MGDNSVNPTDAKTIALHFYDRKGWRPDGNIGRTVNTAKSLLRYGYTVEEVLSVIDYTFDKLNINVYSIGYFNKSINSTLERMKKENKPKTPKVEYPLPTKTEEDNGSSERNKNKISRLNGQSNIGKKYNFDMFEG